MTIKINQHDDEQGKRNHLSYPINRKNIGEYKHWEGCDKKEHPYSLREISVFKELGITSSDINEKKIKGNIEYNDAKKLILKILKWKW